MSPARHQPRTHMLPVRTDMAVSSFPIPKLQVSYPKGQCTGAKGRVNIAQYSSEQTFLIAARGSVFIRKQAHRKAATGARHEHALHSPA